MSPGVLAVLGFVAAFSLMALRVPIGLALAAVGILGFAVSSGNLAAWKLLALSPMESAADLNFAVIPLFVVMGTLARESGISTELYRSAAAWVGRLRGGLAMATITACAGFAAICGSSVATTATMGRISLPEMNRLGYEPRYSTATVAAGGTLGVLIPPSVPFILYGFVTETDIGKLFVAGILPGLVAALMYLAAVRWIAWRRPQSMPASDQQLSLREKFAALGGIWPALLIFSFVIGGIYVGLFTPTEAAAAGAAATLAMTLLQRRLTLRQAGGAFVESIRVSASLFVILIGAVLFGNFLVVTGAPQAISAALTSLPLPPMGTLVLILLGFVILGCFLDTIAMILIFIPIVFPTIRALGFDPVWFGVLVVMVCELGMITPPYGINVFVINGIAREVSLTSIFRGVIPFLVADALRIALVVALPSIALFLPNLMG
ncbi:MAG: TRAP transporter large permease [Burkholderiales bacterium]|nr:TRAP transporter large permease [Burkholderiales bacterium]